MTVFHTIFQQPALFAMILAVPALLAVLAYLFPVASLLAWGACGVMVGSGLGIFALAAMKAPTEKGAILGFLVGAEAGSAAAGAIGMDLMLIAVAGAIRSIRARQT